MTSNVVILGMALAGADDLLIVGPILALNRVAGVGFTQARRSRRTLHLRG